MADWVKCVICGGSGASKFTSNGRCWNCDSTGEQKAEVTGVALTVEECAELGFKPVLVVNEKGQRLSGDGYENPLIKPIERILTARLTALQTAHEAELAELLNEITVRMLERLPKQNPTENNLSTLTVIKLLAEITSAIEAIDKEALK